MLLLFSKNKYLYTIESEINYVSKKFVSSIYLLDFNGIDINKSEYNNVKHNHEYEYNNNNNNNNYSK